ncbi:MAG: hypothetical protein CMO81_03320 [Waddliaceae bacterium]|nr:hypothetical protein [Waddliaceae bacterium]
MTDLIFREVKDVYIVDDIESFTPNTTISREYILIDVETINKEDGKHIEISELGDLYIQAPIKTQSSLEFKEFSNVHIFEKLDCQGPLSFELVGEFESEKEISVNSSLQILGARKVDALGAMNIGGRTEIKTQSWLQFYPGSIHICGTYIKRSDTKITLSHEDNVFKGTVLIETPRSVDGGADVFIQSKSDIKMRDSLISGNLDIHTDASVNLSGLNIITDDLTVNAKEFKEEKLIVGGEITVPVNSDS